MSNQEPTLDDIVDKVDSLFERIHSSPSSPWPYKELYPLVLSNMGYLSGFKRSLFGKNTTGRLGGSYRVTLRKGIMFDTLDVTHLREPQIKACVRELKFGIKRDLYAAALYTYNSENRNFVLSEEVYF